VFFVLHDKPDGTGELEFLEETMESAKYIINLLLDYGRITPSEGAKLLKELE